MTAYDKVVEEIQHQVSDLTEEVAARKKDLAKQEIELKSKFSEARRTLLLRQEELYYYRKTLEYLKGGSLAISTYLTL